jgi:hypothetical protein
MKRFVIGAVVVVAAIAAGVAYSAASPSAKLDKQDRVWGGGIAATSATPTNLVCAQNDPSVCIASPRNLAVDAHAEGNGSQSRWQLRVRDSDITIGHLRAGGRQQRGDRRSRSRQSRPRQRRSRVRPVLRRPRNDEAG